MTTMTPQIQLDCGCVLEFAYSPPREGEHIYCRLCDKPAYVKGSSQQWRAKCRELSCRYSRRFGRAQRNAEDAGGRHAAQYQHSVLVWQEGEDNARLIEPRNEPALFP